MRPNNTYYILAGSLIDGSGREVQRKVYLAVTGSTITGMGSFADLPPHDLSQRVDFSHCTLLPALVDCSVSLAQSPAVNATLRKATEQSSLSDKKELVQQHLRYCDGYGVLGLAENSDLGSLIDSLQTEGNGGTQIVLRIPSAHGLPAAANKPGRQAEGDFLKIHASQHIEYGKELSSLASDELRQLLKKRGGRKAVVVANGEQQVKNALAAGCDAIEQGYSMGKENLRKMAEQEVLWIPGILHAKNGLDGAGSGGDVSCRFSQRYVAPGKSLPGAEAYWKEVLSGHLSLLRQARELGVTTAIGTGAGSVGLLHGESMVEEMKLFMKAGYSLEEAIRCGSENGANFFGMEGLGKLAVGKKATFILTRGTVKQLPRKLNYLEGVYIDGIPSTTYRKHPTREEP